MAKALDKPPQSAPPPDASVVDDLTQDPKQLAMFVRDVMARVDDADSEIYSEEMKHVARESVAKLEGLQRVYTLHFSGGTEILNREKTLQELKAKVLSDSVRNVLAKHENAGFIVLGFADPTGTPTMNSSLSKKRADLIKSELKRWHPKLERIIPIGVGQTTLINASQQKNNRAVEVWLAIPQ